MGQGLGTAVSLISRVGNPADITVFGDYDLRGNVVAVAAYSDSVIRLEGTITRRTIERRIRIARPAGTEKAIVKWLNDW